MSRKKRFIPKSIELVGNSLYESSNIEKQVNVLLSCEGQSQKNTIINFEDIESGVRKEALETKIINCDEGEGLDVKIEVINPDTKIKGDKKSSDPGQVRYSTVRCLNGEVVTIFFSRNSRREFDEDGECINTLELLKSNSFTTLGECCVEEGYKIEIRVEDQGEFFKETIVPYITLESVDLGIFNILGKDIVTIMMGSSVYQSKGEQVVKCPANLKNGEGIIELSDSQCSIEDPVADKLICKDLTIPCAKFDEDDDFFFLLKTPGKVAKLSKPQGSEKCSKIVPNKDSGFINIPLILEQEEDGGSKSIDISSLFHFSLETLTLQESLDLSCNSHSFVEPKEGECTLYNNNSPVHTCFRLIELDEEIKNANKMRLLEQEEKEIRVYERKEAFFDDSSVEDCKLFSFEGKVKNNTIEDNTPPVGGDALSSSSSFAISPCITWALSGMMTTILIYELS